MAQSAGAFALAVCTAGASQGLWLWCARVLLDASLRLAYLSRVASARRPLHDGYPSEIDCASQRPARSLCQALQICKCCGAKSHCAGLPEARDHTSGSLALRKRSPASVKDVKAAPTHKYTNHHSHGAACLPESAAPLPRGGHERHKSIGAQVEGRGRRGPRSVQADPQIGQQLCGNQITARSS